MAHVRIYIIIIVFSFGFSSLLWADTPGKTNAGNKAYRKGDFEGSLKKYREAQITDPGNPALNYNIGNALYKMDNYDEAANEYRKAGAIENKLLQSNVFYNLGNTAFRKGNYEEALENYKKAIDLNPADEDARYNYEYTKRVKLNPKQQNKKGDTNKENKPSNEKNKGSAQDTGTEKDKKQTGEKKDASNMSKEDAERILQYYDEADRNSAKKRKMRMPQLPKVEQDW